MKANNTKFHVIWPLSLVCCLNAYQTLAGQISVINPSAGVSIVTPSSPSSASPVQSNLPGPTASGGPSGSSINKISGLSMSQNQRLNKVQHFMGAAELENLSTAEITFLIQSIKQALSKDGLNENISDFLKLELERLENL